MIEDGEAPREKPDPAVALAWRVAVPPVELFQLKNSEVALDYVRALFRCGYSQEVRRRGV